MATSASALGSTAGQKGEAWDLSAKSSPGPLYGRLLGQGSRALAIHSRQYFGGGMGQGLRASLGDQGAGIGSSGAGLGIKLSHGLQGEKVNGR